MKQETKDLIKGSCFLVGMLLFLGVAEYVFHWGATLLFLAYAHIYKILITFVVCGFIFCLANALYHYKETWQYIKNIDWKDVSGTVGAWLSFAFIVGVLCLIAKGFNGFVGEPEYKTVNYEEGLPLPDADFQPEP